MIPKYGVRGAFQNVVASLWLVPGLLAFLLGPVVDAVIGGRARFGVDVFLNVIIAVSLLFSAVRLIASFHYIRKERRARMTPR
jgi:hypothetical protein